jgi:polysaccharide export outer membrane protein
MKRILSFEKSSRRVFVGLTTSAFILGMAVAIAANAQQTDVQNRPAAQQPYSGRQDASALSRGAGASFVNEDLSKLPVAAGFLLSLSVLDEPDLNGAFRVDQQGDLHLPQVGAVHVAGMTMPEASSLIRQKLLDSRILKDPQVSLNVVEYTAPQVTIVGEVASPGKYPLLIPHTLVDVLALAGGLNAAAGNEVEIVPQGGNAAAPAIIHYSRDSASGSVASVMISPGDTVRVRRAGIVYVLGAVVRPGGYVMQEEGTLNVLQALSLASGTSPAANTSVVHVLRPNDDGSVVDIPLSYKRLTQGKTAPIQLQAKDVVYIPTSKIKTVFANTAGIVNSAAGAAIYTVR